MKISFSILFFCYFIQANTQEKLSKVKITDKIYINLPSSFQTADQTYKNIRYTNNRAPLAEFISEDNNVKLTLNTNSLLWKKESVEIIRSIYKANILSFFDDVLFIQDTIKIVNEREFIVFEFLSFIKNDNSFTKKVEKHYSYIQYTSYNDQVLLLSAECLARYRSQWEKMINQIMQTIRIRD